MKLFFSIAIMLSAINSYAQSPAETEVLKLSEKIFQWEIANKTDSLETVFDEKFALINTEGAIQSQAQYLANIKSGNIVHKRIDTGPCTVTIENNTAIINGTGKFVVVMKGNENTLNLSYIEVFTRPGANAPWKILAIRASVVK